VAGVWAEAAPAKHTKVKAATPRKILRIQSSRFGIFSSQARDYADSMPIFTIL
jgi:hypothetical protein